MVAIPDSPRWDPNAPEARLVVDDFGHAVLALRAHMDDPDRRTLVFTWTQVETASMGGPNDEGRSDHPMYAHGLDNLLWLGEVTAPGQEASVRTWIVPLKEGVAEVTAHALHLSRSDRAPLPAAVAALDLV